MPTDSPFVVREYIFDGQHIREYPGALAHNHEDVVRLHAKSYTPKEVATGRVLGELTIVAFHANAFNKEIYEPFLEQLYQILKSKHGLIIGSIWFAVKQIKATAPFSMTALSEMIAAGLTE
ncbi:putative alpha/Beta hydrolase [Septoria linicola]|nr:putative alpha/Beta hydrolase [Septoria linicola]